MRRRPEHKALAATSAGGAPAEPPRRPPAAGSSSSDEQLCLKCLDPDVEAATDVDTRMHAAYRVLLRACGEDPDRPGLQKTPARAAKALRYLTSGYSTDAASVVGGAMFELGPRAAGEPAPGMVVVRDIVVHSLCEHHLLPFYGVAHIGYLPSARVLGLSKLARIADVFARRLQMQERLTQQIAAALMEETGARGVAVVLECSHMCVCMRGVQKPGSSTTTDAMLGDFATDAGLRLEFGNRVRGPRSAL